MAEPWVEPVAEGEDFVLDHRDEHGGDVPGHPPDEDANLPEAGLEVPGGDEAEVGVFRQGLRGNGNALEAAGRKRDGNPAISAPHRARNAVSSAGRHWQAEVGPQKPISALSSGMEC